MTLNHLVSHHDFDSRMDRLWDLREAQPFKLSDKIKSNMRAVRELMGGPRTAVIAPENDMRVRPLYPLFVESTSQVFRNPKAALEWLERNRLDRSSPAFQAP